MVALSGPVDGSALELGLERLRRWNRPVHCAGNLTARTGYLAGDDEERLGGLEEVLAAGVRCILAARGGFGTTRLLSRLPWQRLQRGGVCLVGFSDLTAVLNPLADRGELVQIHGPMVAAGLTRGDNERRLRTLLETGAPGDILFTIPPRTVVRHGNVTGRSVGGNLSILAALLGTSFEVDLGDAVVFLEEVAEPRYRLDRLLTQLAASATFSGVKALISGNLHRCSPAGDREQWWRRLLLEVAPPGTVVVTGLPFGHGALNMAFPLGAEVHVDTRAGRIEWRA